MKPMLVLTVLMAAVSTIACLTVQPQVMVDLTPNAGTAQDEPESKYPTVDPSIEERVVAAQTAEELATEVNQVLIFRVSGVPASTRREDPNGWRDYTPHRYIDRSCQELFSNDRDARQERLLHQSQLRSQIEEALDIELRGKYPKGRFYDFADEFCDQWFELAIRG